MTDESNVDLPPAPTTEAAPANQPLHLVPTSVVPAGEQEVAAMLAEQARFHDEPEMKAVASQLLAAGHSVRVTARRLGRSGGDYLGPSPDRKRDGKCSRILG